MAPKPGLLARISATLSRTILGREMVGSDMHGNYYYSKMEKHEDGMKERRWVKLSGGDYNANQLPPEWDQWLRKSRLQAPTAEDMAKMAHDRASVKEKAAILDAEDRKRRFQAESLGLAGAQPAEGPNMDRFVQQLTDQGVTQPADQTSGSSAAAQEAPSQPSQPQQKVAGEGRYRRSQAPSQPQQPAPASGSGDAFKPGAWKPPGT
ncbi:hypothetical protein WJX84_008892 [Apatococcus fuscideae]|uniref:NADH dehydrogenase [ubiquinone] 1 alpha subcomplex subunit 12 n=1 Tax=Apatococcus fuscideae TaxID=2026836 RepID=A0AAW1TJL9_9CHLO